MYAEHVRERRMYCPECGRNVLAREKPFLVANHAAACVLTCGLWLPVALLLMVAHAATAGYLCPRCGAKCRAARH